MPDACHTWDDRLVRTPGHMTPRHWARAIANAVNLSTPLGIAVALAGRARLHRERGGLIVAEDYRLRFPIAGAFTVGNVIIVPGRTLSDLATGSPDVLDHEDAHAWQYAYCFGLPFIPAYVAAMGWSWVRTGDRAAANFFEVQADLAKGGYRDYPRRTLREAAHHLATAPATARRKLGRPRRRRARP